MTSELETELDALAGELVEAQDRLLALYDLARTMRGFLEPEPLLEALVAEAMRLVGARAGAALLTREDQAPIVVASAGMPAESPALARLLGDRGQAASVEQRVTAAGRWLLVPVPLRAANRALLVLLRDAGTRFMTPDEKLAAAIAGHAGSHLDGVLLHQESLHQARMELEFDLARAVQLGLTPPLPVGYPGLDVYAESRPASIVGGDFYDFAAAPGDRLLCTLGDVAGHGIPAAMLVAMTRAAVRGAVRSAAGASPAGILERANADLQQDYGRLGLFATVLLSRLDAASGLLTVANAGHSPVIYRPAQGGARLVRADAPPLGVLDEWPGHDLDLRLESGDTLIAATDGFSEAENGRTGEMFGYDRLLRLAERTAGLRAAEIGRAFFAEVDDFSAGGTATDDQTLLVVCRGGS
jgi:sigma-B regulation protein RsbU (phosphoserine phosphatase)